MIFFQLMYAALYRTQEDEKLFSFPLFSSFSFCIRELMCREKKKFASEGGKGVEIAPNKILVLRAQLGEIKI